MKTRILACLVMAIASALFLGPALDAAKPTPARKSLVKPVKKTAKPLPKPAPEAPPVVVRVSSLRYTIERVRLGDKSYLPKAGQKALAIDLSIENADFAALSADPGLVKVWAYSPSGAKTARVDGVILWSRSRGADKPVDMATANTAVLLDAKAEITRLMVQLGDDSFIFDIKGKIARLPKDYADPNDPRGYVPLDQIAMRPSMWYPTGDFSIRLDKAGYTTDALGGKLPPEDTRYRVFNFTLRNDASTSREITPDSLSATAKAEAGPYFRWNRVILRADKDEPLPTTLQPGEEVAVRLFGIQPRGMAFDGFTFRHGEDGRRFLALPGSAE